MKIRRMIVSFFQFFNLKNELEDFDLIHSSIERDIVFKGTNLYILIVAIFIASLGLNMNSIAVIIGAMLISPLMGPINGIGYSIATYDFLLLRKSLKNFGFAVLASLVTSTIYFAISPISTAYSELLNRTSPTIYDVLIAFFGGCAGIIAITNKHKGNVIPGVAIATALMPPLCTAGYGLATIQYQYFFGAFYLFTINTVFIALSSTIVTKVLKIPIRTIVETENRKKVARWITVIITITVVPSLYFGYLLVQKEKFIDSANRYIRTVNVYNENFLLRNEIDPINKTVSLIYGGNSFSEKDMEFIRDRARDFGIEKDSVRIKQGALVKEMQEKSNSTTQLKNEVQRLKMLALQKDMEIDSIRKLPVIGKQLLEELKLLHPQIVSCSFAPSLRYTETEEKPMETRYVLLTGNFKQLSELEKNKIQNWVRIRLRDTIIETIYLP
jgi:uncharacterized hydrophobic protein (TIGR00271 family)